MALGSTLLFQGKLDPAFAHFRRGFETFDPNMQFLDWPGSHPAMEFFRSRLSRVESDAMVYRIKAHFNEQGFGLWATEVPDVARFIGFSGLAVADFSAHFTPCVEVGWRLAFEHWGHGCATDSGCRGLAAGSYRAGLGPAIDHDFLLLGLPFQGRLARECAGRQRQE